MNPVIKPSATYGKKMESGKENYKIMKKRCLLTFLEGPSLMMIGFILVSNTSMRFLCSLSKASRSAAHTSSRGPVLTCSSFSFSSHSPANWKKYRKGCVNNFLSLNFQKNQQTLEIKLYQASIIRLGWIWCRRNNLTFWKFILIEKFYKYPHGDKISWYFKNRQV